MELDVDEIWIMKKNSRFSDCKVNFESTSNPKNILPSMEAKNADLDDEIEVLRSMYGESFVDRPNVWGLPSFAIKITPTDVSNAANYEPTEITGESI